MHPGVACGVAMRRGEEWVTFAEVRNLADHAETTPSGVRDRALLLLLVDTGLRVSEALALRVEDVDHQRKRIQVRRGKGGRPRIVACWKHGLQAVAELLARWPAPKRGLVFRSLRGSKLSTSYVRKLLPRLARVARVNKRVHAHGLRHCYSIRAVERGVPLTSLSVQLGHASVQTTAIYLRRIGCDPALAHIDGADD